MKNSSAVLHKHNQTNPIQKLWNARGAFALVLALTVLPACNQVTRQEARNATAGNVAEDTNQYIGRTVTIRSEPIRKIGPHTFTMSSNQLLGGEPIIVVNATGAPLVLPADDDMNVQVTGQVRRFVLSEINQNYRLGLDPNVYREFENRPAIIAQSAALAPEPGEIAQNPSRFYGQRVAIQAEIEDVRNPNTFTLDEDRVVGGRDLLVLDRNPRQPAQEDQTVVVTGVVRPFVVAELEREYDFNWDAGFVRQIEAEFRDRPVLVADAVYPSALPEDNGALWGLLGLAGVLGLIGLTGLKQRRDNRAELQDAPAYRDPSIR
jgi:hypothetical protein